MEQALHARVRLSVNTIQNLIITGIFVVICVCLSLIVPKFLTLTNIRYLFIQVAYVVISCSATTLVILSGNLDLSIGGLAAMGGVVFAVLARAGIPTLEAAGLAILISGTFVGFVNGTFVSRFRMPSFIVTIATMYIARGIAYIGAGGAVITADLPGDFQRLGHFSIGPLNAPLFYSILVFGIFLFIQNKTTFARQTYAIGSNAHDGDPLGDQCQQGGHHPVRPVRARWPPSTGYSRRRASGSRTARSSRAWSSTSSSPASWAARTSTAGGARYSGRSSAR